MHFHWARNKNCNQKYIMKRTSSKKIWRLSENKTKICRPKFSTIQKIIKFHMFKIKNYRKFTSQVGLYLFYRWTYQSTLIAWFMVWQVSQKIFASNLRWILPSCCSLLLRLGTWSVASVSQSKKKSFTFTNNSKILVIQIRSFSKL